MARYSGPVCKLCRRENLKLFLKGERCLSDKCSFERRPYRPGQHGQRRSKTSEYARHLREKQKARLMYGVLESQFAIYFRKADKQKGVTGENLLRILEKRIDNVYVSVFRIFDAGIENLMFAMLRPCLSDHLEFHISGFGRQSGTQAFVFHR